jgi:hypothetical protein
MALRGEIDLSAVGRETMFVFDDGIVVFEASRLALAGATFGGALGGLISGVKGEVSGRRRERSVAEAIGTMSDASARSLTAQVKGARLFDIDEVTQIRLEKGFANTRKIVIATAGSKDAVFRFGVPMQPEAAAREVLSAVFGDRFDDRLATPS